MCQSKALSSILHPPGAHPPVVASDGPKNTECTSGVSP
jgi:hypothetical protein